MGIVPDSAVFLTVLKNHVQALDTIDFQNLLAVAVHFSEPLIRWREVVIIGLLDRNPVRSRALTLLKVSEVLGHPLEVVVARVTYQQAQDHGDHCDHAVHILLGLVNTHILPKYDLWIDNIMDSDISLLDQSLLLEEFVESAELGGDGPLDPVEVVTLNCSLLALH